MTIQLHLNIGYTQRDSKEDTDQQERLQTRMTTLIPCRVNLFRNKIDRRLIRVWLHVIDELSDYR